MKQTVAYKSSFHNKKKHETSSTLTFRDLLNVSCDNKICLSLNYKTKQKDISKLLYEIKNAKKLSFIQNKSLFYF